MARALPVIIWNNLILPLTTSDIVVSSAAADFDRLNVQDWRPFTQWKPTAVPVAQTGASQVWQVDDSGGPSFVDETTDFNSATINDVDPFPATEAIDDYMAAGFTQTFGDLVINVGTVGVAGVLAWEYWNGTAWVALSGVTDGTTNFTTSGQNSVVFTVPQDWAALVLNGSASLFYVRARITTVYSTNPILTQGFIQSADEWIRFDLGSSIAADTFCLSGHDLLTQGATIKLQTSTDVGFTSPVDVFTLTPADNTTQYVEFTSTSSRWWRVLITGATAPPAFGVIVLSERFTFTRFLSTPFSRLPERLQAQSQRSVKGHVLGRKIEFIQHSITAVWKFYPTNDFDLFQSIWDATLHKDPFIWVWDPGDHPSEALLVQVPDNAQLDGSMIAETRRLRLQMIGIKGG